MSIEEQRRKAFEASIRETHPEDIQDDGEAIFTMADGIYDWYWVREKWQFWNAALDSVVIELPKPWAAEIMPGSSVLEDCKHAIEAAGLKVKP